MGRTFVPPPSLDESSFERLMQQMRGLAQTPPGQITIDLEHLRFIDPYGMVGLLALARFLRQHAFAPVLVLPRSDEVMKYLDRMDFSRHAQGLCSMDLATL